MKARMRRWIFIVVFVILLLFYLGHGQGLMGMFIGLATALAIMNWAFNSFLPDYFVKTKQKILKKIF